MATHSSILAWEILWTEEPVGYSPWGRRGSDTTEMTEHEHCFISFIEYFSFRIWFFLKNNFSLWVKNSFSSTVLFLSSLNYPFTFSWSSLNFFIRVLLNSL